MGTAVDVERESALREAVSGIARSFGPAYYQDEVDRGGGALDGAVSYVKERRVWDVPIGAHQAIARPLALAHIHLRAALTVTDRACRSFDGGASAGELCQRGEVSRRRRRLEALDAAIAAHGGNGVTYEYRLAPYYFLVRMLNMGPVSKEMILNFIAEHSLSLPRSY